MSPLDGTGDVWASWTGPTSWVGGSARGAHVLVPRRQRSWRPTPHEAATSIWRRPSGGGRCGSAASTGAAALVAAVTLELDAESLASGLHGRGLPLILVSAAAGAISLWRLRQQRWASGAGRRGHRRRGDRHRVGRRAVSTICSSTTRTIAEVIGARSTQIGLLIVFALAAVTAVPALVWLYVLVNGKRWAEPLTK